MSQRFLKNMIQQILVLFMVASVWAGETNWVAVGDLHSWFHSAGCEIEVGRTGDQQDGMRWPAQFRYQDNIAAKAFWIGCKNFNDPVANTVYPFKVVHAGPRVLEEQTEFMPSIFTLSGKFDLPSVFVDNQPAAKLDLLEVVNKETDPASVADRVIENEVNTSLGLTMKRTIYAFARKGHSNYYIYDYEFTNTGIINIAGTVSAQTLEDVVFYYQFRYAISREGGVYGVLPAWLPQAIAWGVNTMNDVIYTHPETGDPFRALISWHGKHSKWGGPGDNIGGPNYQRDGHFGASQFAGVITLHADKSTTDPSDDITQPTTTWEFDSDDPLSYGNSQYNPTKMAAEYAVMTSGRPDLSHADRVGSGFADTYGSAGGFSTAAGYGPYTIEPGQTIHIVLAEGVAGLDRQSGFVIGDKWVTNTAPFNLPDGGSTNDRHEYKNAWVFTGRDSLIKTFENAIENFDNNYDLPQAPPPPTEFYVNSGGDRVALSWSNSAEAWTGNHGNSFSGYKVYRAIHKPDTTYDLIYACGAGTENPGVTNFYDDKSAIRGIDYYYYMTSFDDGSTPDGTLESSKFYTMTNAPARLLRPAGSKLSDIRIVPNPYNILSKELQFGGSNSDRIMFYNIPPFCEIKIYTERGDLIKTINHDNGSGDEPWNSVTSSGQVVVSGIYIAHIRVTQDHSDNSGKLVFKKGDSIIKKLAIVR